MKTLRLVVVIVSMMLFLLPAVFLRSVPATASDLPVWTSVQQLRADGWIGSAVIVRMQPSLITANTCNVTMATARHVVAAEILKPDPAGEKLGPNVATQFIQAPGLRWGEVPATATLLHPTQDLAIAVFVAPKPCTELKYAIAVIDTTTTMLPRMPILHVGYPGGWLTIANGIYIGPFRLDLENLGVITSVGGPGSSGGAIFYQGKLVGILVRGETEPPFRNLYAPLVYLTDIWSS